MIMALKTKSCNKTGKNEKGTSQKGKKHFGNKAKQQKYDKFLKMGAPNSS